MGVGGGKRESPEQPLPFEAFPAFSMKSSTVVCNPIFNSLVGIENQVDYEIMP